MELGEIIKKGVRSKPIEAPEFTPQPQHVPEPEREPVPIRRKDNA